MPKKKYAKPKIIVFGDEFKDNLNPYVPGALIGAFLMVARALAKAMKGGIDLFAGIDNVETLQDKDQHV